MTLDTIAALILASVALGTLIGGAIGYYVAARGDAD